MTGYLICFVMSIIATYFGTKISIKIAKKFSFYDIPNERNIHKQPIPLLGGFAILFSVVINTLMVSNSLTTGFKPALIGALFIFLIGVIDDRYKLNPFSKVILQVIIISYVFANGIKIDYLTLPTSLNVITFSPIQSFFVTQLWMLVIINMFNLIDGVDGLAIGISCITATMLFIVSLSVAPVIISYLLISIVGSGCSFLKFNFFPARIFLGDSGALLLGYLFAYISIAGVMKSTISFIILLFIFAIPFMDLLLSVIRRILKRKNIFSPDSLHIHHQMVSRGLSVRKTVLVLYLMCGVIGGIGIFISFQALNPILYTMGCVILMIVFIFFNYLQLSKKPVRSSNS